MGSFGRITSKKDLPPDDTIIKLVQQAVELNEKGVKAAKAKPATAKKELVVPDYLTAALKKNKAAQKTFENFPYSCKKEYVEWITEPKPNRRAKSVSPRPSNGCPKENEEIGNTRTVSWLKFADRFLIVISITEKEKEKNVWSKTVYYVYW